jgi:hypothetical protein
MIDSYTISEPVFGELRHAVDDACAEIDRLRADNAELRTANTRMRAALRKIMRDQPAAVDNQGDVDWPGTVVESIAIARAALSPEPDAAERPRDAAPDLLAARRASAPQARGA